jgi:hypothetical protein
LGVGFFKSELNSYLVCEFRDKLLQLMCLVISFVSVFTPENEMFSIYFISY